MGGRKFFKKADALVLLAAIALCAALALIPGKSGAFADIILDGETVKTVSLAEDAEFSLDLVPGVIIEVKGGAIRVSASDCPDKTCVRTGFISRFGQSAVCLPNKLVIKISGGGDNRDLPDIIAR